jgi:hypothetical protein
MERFVIGAYEDGLFGVVTLAWCFVSGLPPALVLILIGEIAGSLGDLLCWRAIIALILPARRVRCSAMRVIACAARERTHRRDCRGLAC